MSKKEKKAKKPMKKSTKILIGVFLALCVISAFVDESETDNNVTISDSDTKIEEQQPIDIVEDEPIIEQKADPEPVEEELPDILTVENCEDLKEILTGKYNEELYINFAKKYKDKLIQFDGNIFAVELKSGYETQYIVTLQYGDYIDDNTASSPLWFMIESTNPSTVGIGGPRGLYNWAKNGANVTITTSVQYYDDEIDYMMLNKLETTIEQR